MVLVSHLAQGTPCLGVSCLVAKGRGDLWGAEQVCQVCEEF